MNSCIPRPTLPQVLSSGLLPSQVVYSSRANLPTHNPSGHGFEPHPPHLLSSEELLGMSVLVRGDLLYEVGHTPPQTEPAQRRTPRTRR